MTVTTTALPRRHVVDRPFFLITPLLLAGIAVAGFSKTVPGDLTTDGFPALLWVHAGAFGTWVLLFVAQPALIAAGSLRLHRHVGWAGIVLAFAMVALGAIAVLMGLWADHVPPFYPHGLFLIRGMVGLLLFAGFVAAGALNRKRPAWHKRFMLCASLVVIVPGLERAMPLPLFGSYWPFAVDGVIDTIALAGPAADLLGRGRIHPAYAWCLGAIVAGQILVYLLAPSGVAIHLLHALGAK